MAERRVDRPSVFVADNVAVYWSFAGLLLALGAILMAAPDDWYGPSWHYFTEFPRNGFWMGAVCLCLSLLQLVTLWRNRSRRLLALLLGASGFVLWTAAVCLAMAGWWGHGGLMESPFMFVVGGHKLIHSAALTMAPKRRIRL